MESDTRASMQTSLMHFLTWHWDLLWGLHDEAVLPWSTIHKLRGNIWHLSMKLVVRLCVSTGFWGSLQSAICTLLKLQLRWRRLESAAYNIFFTNLGVYLILITRTAIKICGLMDERSMIIEGIYEAMCYQRFLSSADDPCNFIFHKFSLLCGWDCQ